MTDSSTAAKKSVAVFLGGRSPEHDVSVVSGLQVFQAIDRTKYDPFIVYVAGDGGFYVGGELESRDFYVPSGAQKQALCEVVIDAHPAEKGKGALVAKSSGLFAKPKRFIFDIALPVFHGLSGENGAVQGMFEMMNVPYAGMRVMGAGVAMDKVATKRLLRSLDIATLPFVELKRPQEGYLVPARELEAQLKDLEFPVIVKPSHLGSSIGVAKAKTIEDVAACLPAIFKYDTHAIIEPFVKNLVEYNVAVMRKDGEVITSAIERPKGTDDLLDFKQKYCSGGDGKTGVKTGGVKNPGQISEGMLSLTRELNPKLTTQQEDFIRSSAIKFFEAAGGAGSPRIDFIGDSKSGEIWFNEVNPCPGSYGYFLWEAAAQPLLFTKFVSALLEEARVQSQGQSLPDDPVPADAQLFKRKD